MTASPRTTPIRRCVVAGGSGAVGALFGELLAAAGADVCVVDPAPPRAAWPGVRHLPGDVTAPDDRLRAELAATDLLLLAVPEPVALAAVPGLPGVLNPDALFADTLSVKSRVAAAITAHLPEQQALGLNPMFAPALDMAGRPVAAVVLHDGPLVHELLRLITEHGGRVVRMDAHRHDRVTAACQVLTHATVLSFGRALSTLDVTIDELAAVAPPPHAVLLALLARIVTGTPEVYWDIQSANPFAPDARDALAQGVRWLQDLTRDGSEEEFARSLHAFSQVLGNRLPHYQDVCATLFARMPTVEPEETP